MLVEIEQKMWALEFLEHEMRPVFRLQSGHRERRVSVGLREGEREVLQDAAERHLGLDQREVLADADPWTPAEREERRRVLGRPGDAVLEPLRAELVGVLSPHVLVVVNEDDRQREQHPGRVRDAAQLDLVVRLPIELHDRRVQPEHLVQYHGHLQGRPNKDRNDRVSQTCMRSRVVRADSRAKASERATDGFQLLYAVQVRPVVSEDAPDLLPRSLLPLRVRAQDDHRPREQHSGGIHPGEVEQLQLPDDVVHGHDWLGAPVLSGLSDVGLHQHAQQVVVVGTAFFHGPLPLADDASQERLDLSRVRLQPSV
jgi:hypothetical protein